MSIEGVCPFVYPTHLLLDISPVCYLTPPADVTLPPPLCDAFGAADSRSGSILGVMNVFNKHRGSMRLMKV